MKKQDLLDIKALDIKSLAERVSKIREEISELILDKNMNKLKDVKSISRKRKELAQVSTILNQKQLLEQFEKGGEK